MLIDITLTTLFMFAIMSGKAPSISFILAAVLVYRVAPAPYGMGGAGFIILFAGALARRKRTRDGSW